MKYNVPLRRTASSTLAVGALYADAAAPRLMEIHRFMFSAYGTMSDAAFRVQVQRSTTAPSGGSAVTPTPLNPGAQAAVNDAHENPTTNGSLTAGELLLDRACHARAQLDLYLPPGLEWLVPATAGHGVHVLTPTGPEIAVVAQIGFAE